MSHTRPVQDGAGSIPRGRASLRALRRARRWTQQDLSRAFERKSREIGRPLSLSVRQIRRWESENPPWPLPAYQRVLEALFDLPVTAMGFVPCWTDTDPVLLSDGGFGVPDVSRNQLPRQADGLTGCVRPGFADPVAGDHVRTSQPAAGADPAGVPTDVGERAPTAFVLPAAATGGGVPGSRQGGGPFGRFGSDRRGSGGENGTGVPAYQADEWDIEYEAVLTRGSPLSGLLGAETGRGGAPGRPGTAQPPSPPPPGTDAALARPASPEREDPLERRQFLNGAIAMTGALAITGSRAADALRVPDLAVPERVTAPPQGIPAAFTVDSGSTGQFAAITEQQRSMYWVMPAPVFYESVRGHAELGMGLLSHVGTQQGRAQLGAAAAESSLLAARISFFDLQQPDRAGRHYRTALAAAREARDPLLTSAILAHISFVPAYDRMPEARRYIAAAHYYARRGGASPNMRAWLYAVEAEVEAKLGNGQGSLARIADSEATLDAAHGGEEDPAWLDFFDRARLSGYRGFCELAANRPGNARRALLETYRTLDGNAVKQRAVALADIAGTYAHEGEVDEACAVLGQSLDILSSHSYATANQRINEVRLRLDPYRNTRPVQYLDQQLRNAASGFPKEGQNRPVV